MKKDATGRGIRMKKQIAMLLILVAAAATAGAHYSTYDDWDEDYTVQALLGAVRFENLSLDIPDSADSREIDLSTLPQLGGAWTTLPLGDRLQVGLEASFLLGFKADKVNYIAAGGGGLVISISTSLWLFDLAGGAYANLFLDKGRNVRIYGGAGPLLMYADYRSDKEFDDSTPDEEERKTAFGAGVYARTGIEIRVHETGMVGLGARGTWAHLDFSEVGGRSDLAGIGVFATYTIGF
jgi:hypothetical protein